MKRSIAIAAGVFASMSLCVALEAHAEGYGLDQQVWSSSNDPPVVNPVVLQQAVVPILELQESRLSGGRVPILASAVSSDRIEVQTDDSLPPKFSLLPAPRPHASSFLIGEVGVMYRISGESRYPDLAARSFDEDREIPILVTGHLGLMTNLGARNALGFAGYFGGSGDSWRFGVDVRDRVWLSRSAALDLGAGVLLIGGNSQSDVSLPGFAGLANIAVNDWFGISTRVEVIEHRFNQLYVNAPLGDRWTEVSWYAGGRLGGIPGLALGCTAAALYVLAQAAAASVF